MLCPHCHGSGWSPSIDASGPRPCEECGQLGHLHCCEGDQEPPEAADVWQQWIDLGGDHD